MRGQIHFPCETRDCTGLDRRENRRHEQLERFRIDDCISHLIRLGCHKAPPDRISLRPEILPFVIEAITTFIDDRGKRHAVKPGHDAAVELWRTPVYGNGMALSRVADAFNFLIQQILEHDAAIVRRASDQEIPRSLAPSAGQPVDVSLIAARGDNDRTGKETDALTVDICRDLFDPRTVTAQMHDLRVIADFNAQCLGGAIVGIDERFSAAQKKRVRTAERKRP